MNLDWVPWTATRALILMRALDPGVREFPLLMCAGQDGKGSVKHQFDSLMSFRGLIDIEIKVLQWLILRFINRSK